MNRYLGALGAIYQPSGEEQRKLIYLGVKTQWDLIVSYLNDLKTGVISKDTGSKAFDLGDLEDMYGQVYTNVFLLILPNSISGSGYFESKPPQRNSSGPVTNKIVGTNRFGNMIKSLNTAGSIYDEDSASLVILKTLVDWDRPAADYQQFAVSNEYKAGNTQEEQNKILLQSLADTNTAIKNQIQQTQQAFQQEIQEQAKVNEFQNQYETAQEQMYQVQNQVNDLNRLQNIVDNNTDLIYIAQRQEQERQRQAFLQQQNFEQQAINAGNKQATQFATQEQKQITQLTTQGQLDKLKQIATNTATGTSLQKNATTAAKTNFANTTAKPLTTTKVIPKSNLTRIEQEQEEDVTTTPENENGMPTWAWVAIGIAGASAVAGGAYYMSKKGKKGKGKKKKSKSKKK